MLQRRYLTLLAVPVLIAGVGCTPPQIMVYSAGFSFSKYDYLVFAKPAQGTTTALYGLDVEVANLMARYNMTIIGDKEFPGLKPEDKERTLFVRFAVTSSSKKINLITVSFDDAISGKTVANVTSQSDGDLFQPKYRTRALERVSQPLSEALTREKGLKVTSPANG